MQKELIPLKDIPNRWDIPLWTLYKYSAKGIIPTVKIGSRVYVHLKDWEKFLEKNKRGDK
ncbi:helix-turn-helix domain-containing protein [Desulfobacterota bacterium AH_259_B03_O07]|nr:helix-turn-helix domain-containing protein [Desulfobacterota bacterium AH_259_B03_O07]